MLHSPPVSSSLSPAIATSLPTNVVNLTASINGSPTISTRSYPQSASRPLLKQSNENKILVSRYIMFIGVPSKPLAAASVGMFLLDLLDQSPFLGIQLVFWKVSRLGNDKWNIASYFLVELLAIQRSQAIGMVWIEQQGVKHRAQDRPIAPVLLQRLPNGIFQFPIHRHHQLARLDAQLALLVGRHLRL